MATTSFNFTINHSTRVSGKSTGVEITNLADFWRIVDLGFPEISQVGHGNALGAIRVICDEEDFRLREILSILQKSGLNPSPNKLLAINERSHFFGILKDRVYTNRDIAHSSLLRLIPKSGENAMAEICYPKSRPAEIIDRQTWLEYGRREIGSDEDGWRVRANKRLQKNLDLGHLDQFMTLILSESLKARLETAKLKGLSFRPVIYDHPDRAVRQLYQFSNTPEMPECLLPRQTDAGEICLSNEVDGVVWNDGGYRPEELRFRADEVKKMGEFDIAMTREKVGSALPFMHSEVIISQKFRKVLDELRIKTADYVPVHLIE